jgi:hypothetical protein
MGAKEAQKKKKKKKKSQQSQVSQHYFDMVPSLMEQTNKTKQNKSSRKRNRTIATKQKTMGKQRQDEEKERDLTLNKHGRPERGGGFFFLQEPKTPKDLGRHGNDTRQELRELLWGKEGKEVTAEKEHKG